VSVTLRENYGSGFTFPLFFINCQGFKPLAIDEKSSTAIPHAEQLQENKIVANPIQIIFVKVLNFDKDVKTKHETYFSLNLVDF
jgi:hypothetical protein